MRFTIRDLLWLTVVVALGAGFASERWSSNRLRHELALEGQRLQLWMGSSDLYMEDIRAIKKELPSHGLQLVWAEDTGRPVIVELESSLNPSAPAANPSKD